MNERKNPTNEQLLRRLRRPPDSPDDPRYKIDPYWVLRQQRYPHAYAKKAFRDQLPVIRQCTALDIDDEYTRGIDECFYPAGSTYTRIEVEVRPDLSEQTIRSLASRTSEYTVWDSEVRLFGVRVRASGHKSYIVYYRIRHQTKLHKYTIGRVGEFSLEQARDVARHHRREARMGNDPVSARPTG